MLNTTQAIKAYKYAENIIMQTKSLVDFIVSLMDVFGEEHYYEYFTILDEIKQNFSVQFVIPDSPYTANEYQEKCMVALKELQAKTENIEDLKQNLDELQFYIQQYRDTDEFQKMLDFVGKFKELAPYNAMLIERQKPGATFVLSLKDWRDLFHRQPKVNAQNLITLLTFGPVQIMFDYDDTEHIPGMKEIDAEELMQQWNESINKANGNVSDELQILLENLPKYGILYDNSFNAASSFGGYLLRDNNRELYIKYKNSSFKLLSRFVISVNRNLNSASQFATICHELGHLFCKHLYYDREKERDNLSHKQQEFEAETVAWLVCKRHGIENPSEKYLATYAPKGKEIPICSIETIMAAVTEIEKMIKSPLSIKEAMWYKQDKEFKKYVDEVIIGNK